MDVARDASVDHRPGIDGSQLDLSYHGDPVVHDASIAIPGGQVTALVGPNGSGKSTLSRPSPARSWTPGSTSSPTSAPS